PDRRRRTAFRFPRPERSALLMRERQSSSPDSGSAGNPQDSGSAGKPQEDNPFAAPPADRPDQPWQPRRPSGSQGQGQGSDEQNSDGSGSGGDRPAWGSQWSD
ncbi:hypothetical protein G3M53_74230, partial [Streptomyces sp. SID7982]|nr:hypothetical protein [Streptomyces sp. SID7982]